MQLNSTITYTFKAAIAKYLKVQGVYRRGHVEFIYASLNKMTMFGVHKELSIYKALIDLFPKEKMVVQSVWQVEMMHYPKQQQCCIDILEKMEFNGQLYKNRSQFRSRRRLVKKCVLFSIFFNHHRPPTNVEDDIRI